MLARFRFPSLNHAAVHLAAPSRIVLEHASCLERRLFLVQRPFPVAKALSLATFSEILALFDFIGRLFAGCGNDLEMALAGGRRVAQGGHPSLLQDSFTLSVIVSVTWCVWRTSL